MEKWTIAHFGPALALMLALDLDTHGRHLKEIFEQKELTSRSLARSIEMRSEGKLRWGGSVPWIVPLLSGANMLRWS
jgi:hypothetical protein